MGYSRIRFRRAMFGLRVCFLSLSHTHSLPFSICVDMTVAYWCGCACVGTVFGMTFAKPRPATTEDIQHIVASFAHAASYLEAAGYDGIELHAAHGYLFAQFLSLTTNLRTDHYGGSLQNRARLITEVAASIRKATKPDFISSASRSTASSSSRAGFQPEEAKELCRILEQSRFRFCGVEWGDV